MSETLAGKPKGRDRFTEFRRDGWPLCPQCGDDELYSDVCLFNFSIEEIPRLDDCLEGEFGCYYCGWHSDSLGLKKVPRLKET